MTWLTDNLKTEQVWQFQIHSNLSTETDETWLWNSTCKLIYQNKHEIQTHGITRKKPRISFNTYTQCRPLGGWILLVVAAVDAMSLHQLVSRRICPEVVCCLHLCVFQGTRANWNNEGAQLSDHAGMSSESLLIRLSLTLMRINENTYKQRYRWSGSNPILNP